MERRKVMKLRNGNRPTCKYTVCKYKNRNRGCFSCRNVLRTVGRPIYRR